VIEVCTQTAVWYHTGLPPVPIRWVLIRDPQQCFDPQALLCTDLTQNPLTMVRWFVRRWQVEVTFQEVRKSLGVETQRQWTQQAIARTTPCLLALFSVVTLPADRLVRRGSLPLPQEAWYRKARPTFADALAAVRQHDWRHAGFLISPRKKQGENYPAPCGSVLPMHSAVRPEGQSRAEITRSQKCRSSVLICALLTLTITNEFRGTPPHLRFQGSHVAMCISQ
jgi:hypothetical protein